MNYYKSIKEAYSAMQHPMIDVDGVLKHRHNSLGQPIHHTDEGIKNFHRWFGDSKIADEHGRPKVMYHGTSSDVSEFSKIGGGNQWGKGFYFHPSTEVASQYATGETTGIHSRIAPEGNAAPNIIPVFMSMKKPFVMDAPLEKSTIRDVENHIGESLTNYTWSGMKNRDLHQQLHQNFLPSIEAANSALRQIGFDGITEKSSGIHMAFEPSQIKSVIGNDGSFDHPTRINESVDHPMIMLDGIPRHMNNSEGKPIHPTQEGIYNFHRWFGKSKAVDEHGRPQVFYHGTGKDFDRFSHDFTGTGTDAHGSGFYFAKNPDTANTYATSHVLPVYLKLTKPIDRTSEKELSRTHIQKMITSAPNHLESLENFGDVVRGYSRVLSDAVDAYSGSSKFESMAMIHNDFYGKDHKNFLDNFKKHTGHDGVMVKDENVATVFHPSQIKSAIGNDGSFAHPTKINEDAK